MTYVFTVKQMTRAEIKQYYKSKYVAADWKDPKNFPYRYVINRVAGFDLYPVETSEDIYCVLSGCRKAARNRIYEILDEANS